MNNYLEDKIVKVRRYVGCLMRRQVAAGILLFLAGLCYKQEVPWALGWGILAGWGDNFFVLRGISKGMEKEIHQAARHMHGTMLSRIGVLLIAVVLGFYLGITAYSVFGAYLFLHMTLLVNMIILARKNNPAKEN